MAVGDKPTMKMLTRQFAVHMNVTVYFEDIPTIGAVFLLKTACDIDLMQHDGGINGPDQTLSNPSNGPERAIIPAQDRAQGGQRSCQHGAPCW